MLTEFDEAVEMALMEGFIISSRVGTATIYDLFNHLSEGGTVDDFTGLEEGEAAVMLGVAYVTLLRNLED